MIPTMPWYSSGVEIYPCTISRESGGGGASSNYHKSVGTCIIIDGTILKAAFHFNCRSQTHFNCKELMRIQSSGNHTHVDTQARNS